MSRAIDRMPEPAEYREKKVIIIARSRLVACSHTFFPTELTVQALAHSPCIMP